MRRSITLSFLAAGFLLALNLNGFAQTEGPRVAPKIAAIHAQLYYEPLGKFSPDVLADKSFAFWNVIIGEGSAEAASSSTLVTVEITGKHLAVGSTKVEVTATGDKNKVLLKKLIAVDIYDERTKFFAPFWLYDTGCEKIKITARLIGKGVSAAPVTKTINFACGE